MRINSADGKLIFEAEADSIKSLLCLAVLSLANLGEADLSGANLRRAGLSLANLSGADLGEADLSDANLRRADLSDANLRRADLSDADLSGAKLSWANLGEADLSGAKLSGANLRRADLSLANLRRADLSWANLGEANLSGTCLDPKAKIPDSDMSEFERDGDKLIVLRTSESKHCGSINYSEPGEYVAPLFSVDISTECHPGIYFATLDYLSSHYPGHQIVKGFVYASEALHAGHKYRAKRFFSEGIYGRD